ncbi:hypothetical protein KKP04_07500 [Rhodomicrobium sp. Az07]|uniref:hypothetical protein n=1 Tax=Rhodomicrobium sp. Az07 TaxID=2839034 RepID=UPI001BEC5340|nr:hypothetical protein [Rhodomicrobium sp. Az07]MBT3070709.1 hypothetical protein [Rhodomicrobium sp. Az07]
MPVSFADPKIARKLEALSDEERHDLPFGVIKLDTSGLVVFFSRTEARQSGWKKRPAIGIDFFVNIAPCMATPEFKGRIDEAARHGVVDFELGWVGDFDDPNGEMTVRIQSAADGGLWICLERPE